MTPGKWSVIEVVQHLAASDLVFSYRLKMVLTEDRPPLRRYDQDRWARDLRYREVPLKLALERVGLHSERGPESAGFLLKLMGAHDLVHRRQIDRILAGAAAQARKSCV